MVLRSRDTRILAIGLPKAGTHLLTGTLRLMGLADSHTAIHPGAFRYSRIRHLPCFVSAERCASSRLLIGVDNPTYVAKQRVLKRLKRVRLGSFASSHLIYSVEMAQALENLSFKTVSIIRDPRDVAVSHYLYIMRRPRHSLHDLYMKMDSDAERLRFSFTGGQFRDNRIPDICERVRSVLRWSQSESNLTTTFEKLIGEEGGGSRILQIQEIEKLASHLNLALSSKRVEQISEQIFSRESQTFRKGKIGDWRNYFSEGHKAAFKVIAGDLLVELGYETGWNW